jgi:predicted permease
MWCNLQIVFFRTGFLMSFFDKYNGTSNTRLLRMERMIWPLIYGGLLALVLAWFTDTTQGASATGLYAVGSVALAMGLVVFYLRSREKDE